VPPHVLMLQCALIFCHSPRTIETYQSYPYYFLTRRHARWLRLSIKIWVKSSTVQNILRYSRTPCSLLTTKYLPVPSNLSPVFPPFVVYPIHESVPFHPHNRQLITLLFYFSRLRFIPLSPFYLPPPQAHLHYRFFLPPIRVYLLDPFFKYTNALRLPLINAYLL